MIMDANHSSGASPFLANLPFRGVFSSTVLSSKPVDKQVYMCDHDTSPPEGQQIKTNQQDILVRSLTLTKQRGDSKSKDGAKGSRNRHYSYPFVEEGRFKAAQKVSASRASAKRTHNEMNSQQGSASRKSSEPRAKLSREREILEKEQRSLGEILSLFAKEQRVITAEYRMMVCSMEKELIKMEKRLEVSSKRWSTLLAKIEAGTS